ncbi:MAG: hypothetical protein H6737_02760 [Alphaproteobacteria bacterium]|nr:hypothetical protein [Alphaproteobacteria bacterium]
MWFLLTLSAARAECAPADLEPALDRAEAAYMTGDRDGLVSGIRDAKAALACTSPSAAMAARVLRAEALVDALENDWVEAEEGMRASVAAHPLLPLPPTLERDQRLHLAWQRAQEASIGWTVGEGMQLVNGTMMPLRPDTRVLGAKGGRGGARNGVRIVSLGLGVAAAGLYGAAWGSRFQYDRALDDGRNAEALKHYRSTNGLSIASVGALGAGIGLFGVSFAL